MKTLEIASIKVRLIGYIIDISIIIFITFGLQIASDTISDSFYQYVIFCSVLITYYIILESIFDKTIGKVIMKTSVISIKDYCKPTFVQILWRTLSRLIPFDPFSYLFKSGGIHDLISKTEVIRYYTD